MKLNIANPQTGAQKIFDIEDEARIQVFRGLRIASTVEGDSISPEFNGYKFKITGGNDKQGFPMQQGILTTGRVRRLLKAGDSCYRPRRDGEKRRKSVRGCIISSEIAVLSLIIVKKGGEEIVGLTDEESIRAPSKMPKRANRVIKYLNDLRAAEGSEPIQYANDESLYSHIPYFEVPSKIEGKPSRFKHVKIQRLVTDKRIRDKARITLAKAASRAKSRHAAELYKKALTKA